jgi:PAS domain S-box-containing protein
MKAQRGNRNAPEDSFPLAGDLFRILTEVVAAAVVIYQGDRILYANRSAEALCGRPRGALVGLRLSDLVYQDHRERVIERALARQRREMVPRRYEFKILTGDGHERWVEFTGEYLEIEGKPAALGTLYDITEHRKALAVLLEAEQKYTELFESCEEGIFRGTPGGALLQVNPSFARGLGYDSPQELMERVTDVSSEIFADQGRHAELMRALEEKGSVRGFEAPLRGSGGRWSASSCRRTRWRQSAGWRAASPTISTTS